MDNRAAAECRRGRRWEGRRGEGGALIAEDRTGSSVDPETCVVGAAQKPSVEERMWCLLTSARQRFIV